MFKNALSKISSGINSSLNKIKEAFPFWKTQEYTKKEVNSVLNIPNDVANDKSFAPQTQSTIKSTADNIVNIQTDQKPINILWDFSGRKRFKFRKNEYELQFKDWVIINAFRNINWKSTPVKATTIRQISALLKKSTREINKVSYSTKRNAQNTFNTRLHGQYTYTNESKTQFTIIVNKGQILETTYKNTKNKASQEEIQLIQSSINKSTQWLSGHKSVRLVKKERAEARLKKESELNVTHKMVKEEVEKPKLNWNKKHDNFEQLKYKNKLREEELKQKEKSKILRWSFIKQDTQLLNKHLLTLSKTDKIWNIEYIRQIEDEDWNIKNAFDFNKQQDAIYEIFSILWARKWIYNKVDIEDFINKPEKFRIFEKLILSYLEWEIPEEMETYRSVLLDIFKNATEIKLQQIPQEKKYWTIIDWSTWELTKYAKKSL